MPESVVAPPASLMLPDSLNGAEPLMLSTPVPAAREPTPWKTCVPSTVISLLAVITNDCPALSPCSKVLIELPIRLVMLLSEPAMPTPVTLLPALLKTIVADVLLLRSSVLVPPPPSTLPVSVPASWMRKVSLPAPPVRLPTPP